MTIKTLFAAALLATAPALALAEGCNWTTTAHHCGVGQIFDEAKGTCIDQPSS